MNREAIINALCGHLPDLTIITEGLVDDILALLTPKERAAEEMFKTLEMFEQGEDAIKIALAATAALAKADSAKPAAKERTGPCTS